MKIKKRPKFLVILFFNLLLGNFLIEDFIKILENKENLEKILVFFEKFKNIVLDYKKCNEVSKNCSYLHFAFKEFYEHITKKSKTGENLFLLRVSYKELYEAKEELKNLKFLI